MCALSCPPLPVNAIDTAAALLVIAIEPVAPPVVNGANVTFNIAVCVGANVVFAAAPPAVKPAPVASTLLIVTFVFPVFINVTLSELLFPTATLPKSRLPVLALNDAVVAIPLPLTAMASGEFKALLASEIVPVAAPAPVGANTTLNVALCPTAMLSGSVNPDVLKPAPLTLALLIVAVAVPVFCSVIVCELLEPMVTDGKLALAGVAESCACAVLGGGVFVGGGVLGPGVLFAAETLDPATSPAQPLLHKHAATATATRHFDIFCNSDLFFPIVR